MTSRTPACAMYSSTEIIGIYSLVLLLSYFLSSFLSILDYFIALLLCVISSCPLFFLILFIHSFYSFFSFPFLFLTTNVTVLNEVSKFLTNILEFMRSVLRFSLNYFRENKKSARVDCQEEEIAAICLPSPPS